MADRVLRVVMVGDERDLERGFDRASRASSRLNNNFGKLSRGALVGSGALGRFGRAATFASGAFLGGAGITALLTQSSAAASNLAEQTSKAAVVFGRSTSVVQRFAKDSLALATDEALSAAAAFGALLRPMGVTEKAAAQTSTRLVQLAVDLASFSNTPLPDALQAIQSGLVGEIEPLRRFGILLSEARVQQEALHETGRTSVKALTAQEKVQARLALIFKDSAQAQGDFARTQGSLANQQRILAANIRDLEGAIGGALNPSILKATKSLNAWLSDSENQARVQRDVAETVRVSSRVLRDFAAALNAAADAVGGFKNLIEGLVALKLATVFAGWSRALTALGGAAGEAGAAGQVGLLLTRLGILSSLGPITATIIIAEKTRRDPHSILDRFDFVRGHLKELEGLPTVGPVAQSINAGLAPFKAEKERQRKASEALKQIGPHGQLRGALPEASQHLRRVNEQTDVLNAELRKAARKTGISTKLRNEWFDAMIGRREDRVQDLSSLSAQVAEYDQIAALIQQRISKTKDITRRLNLEDELSSVRRSRKSVLEQIAQDAKDAAERAIRLRKEAAAKQHEALVGRQFRALGLTGTGAELTPGVKALRRQLGGLDKALDGTFLDTRKTNTVLSRIRKVLSGGLGTVAGEVRSKIKEMLDDLDQQLKNHENRTLTRGRALSSNAILSGLGLDRDTMKILQGRLSTVGVGGRVLGRAGTGAPSALGFALSGAGAGINIHGPITVVADNPDVFIRELQKKARRTATQTTGPHAGNSSGFTR